jgi:hypothetical protein
MKFYGRLAAILVMLALVGCGPVAAGPGQAPNAPYSPENNGSMHDSGGGSSM